MDAVPGHSLAPAEAHRLQASAQMAATNRTSSSGGPEVGAAVLASDGQMFSGAYIRGSTCYTTVHAEVAAIVQALSARAPTLVALALFASQANSEGELQPCGTCLQFLAERGCGPELPIFLRAGTDANWEWTSLGALLPKPWVPWERATNDANAATS